MITAKKVETALEFLSCLLQWVFLMGIESIYRYDLFIRISSLLGAANSPLIFCAIWRNPVCNVQFVLICDATQLIFSSCARNDS